MNAKDISKPDNAPTPWTVPLLGTVTLLALLSASCCVLPIAFSILGLGGAWLTMLGPFVEYRVPLLVLTSAIIVWGWVWHLNRNGSRLSLALLTVATMSLVLAVTAPQWEQSVSQLLWTYWRDTR